MHLSATSLFLEAWEKSKISECLEEDEERGAGDPRK